MSMTMRKRGSPLCHFVLM